MPRTVARPRAVRAAATCEAAEPPARSSARRSAARRLLCVIGPAWIVMLADVDAPSVISAGQAGTEFAYATILPLLLCVPVLYLVQEMTARLGVATGRGHVELIRARYGAGWASVAVLAMMAIDLIAYVAEFAGIALGAAIIGIAPPVAIGGALVLHSVWVLTGSYRRFERITLGLSLSLFAFVALALSGRTDPGAVIGGLSPLQPFAQARYRDLVVALVGASIMPWMLFYQQAATVDKRLVLADLPAARRETLLGAATSQGLMVAVVIAAAAAPSAEPALRSTLGTAAVGLPEGLARLAAGGSGWLVAVGLIGAGLLATVVISLSAAWAWSELFGWPRSLDCSPRQARGFYLLYLLEVVPAAGIALLAPGLVGLVLDAMILNVVVLAVPLAFLIRLSSDRELLGPLANSRRRAALLWLITASLLGAGLASLAHLGIGSGA